MKIINKFYFLLFVLLFLFVAIPVCGNINFCYANEDDVKNETSDAEEMITEEVLFQLDGFDFSELEELLEDVDSFEGFDFKEFVKRLILGEETIDVGDVSALVVGIIKENILGYISIFLSIIAIAVLSSLGGELFSKKQTTVSSVVTLVFYSVVAILVSALVSLVLSDVVAKVATISKFVEIVFPILLTCLISVGANSTAILLQPSILYVVSFFVSLVTKFLIPLIVFGLICKILGNISESIKLDKLNTFISSLFKWVLGLSFTIFIPTNSPVFSVTLYVNIPLPALA